MGDHTPCVEVYTVVGKVHCHLDMVAEWIRKNQGKKKYWMVAWNGINKWLYTSRFSSFISYELLIPNI